MRGPICCSWFVSYKLSRAVGRERSEEHYGDFFESDRIIDVGHDCGQGCDLCGSVDVIWGSGRMGDVGGCVIGHGGRVQE